MPPSDESQEPALLQHRADRRQRHHQEGGAPRSLAPHRAGGQQEPRKGPTRAGARQDPAPLPSPLAAAHQAASPRKGPGVRRRWFWAPRGNEGAARRRGDQRGRGRKARYLPGGGGPAPSRSRGLQQKEPAAARELEQRRRRGGGGPGQRAAPPQPRPPARLLLAAPGTGHAQAASQAAGATRLQAGWAPGFVSGEGGSCPGRGLEIDAAVKRELKSPGRALCNQK